MKRNLIKLSDVARTRKIQMGETVYYYKGKSLQKASFIMWARGAWLYIDDDSPALIIDGDKVYIQEE